MASIIGTFFVRTSDGGKIMGALYKGMIAAGVLAAIAFYPITNMMMGRKSCRTQSNSSACSAGRLATYP